MIRHKQPKGIHSFVDRHGTRRLYLRRGLASGCPLPGPLYSPAFWTAYHAALAQPRTVARVKAGTFDALIATYYASSAFSTLAPSTQRAYRNILERWRETFGEEPVKALTRQHVQALMEAKSKTPAAANDLLKLIRILMRLAIRLEMRADDPTLYVEPIRYKVKEYRTWSEADIAKFKAAHPLGTMPRLAMELMLCTGQRRSDAVTMGRQHVRDGLIHVVQVKTGARLAIPLHRDLVAAIDATPSGGNLTFSPRLSAAPSQRPVLATGSASAATPLAYRALPPMGCGRRCADGSRKLAARRSKLCRLAAIATSPRWRPTYGQPTSKRWQPPQCISSKREQKLANPNPGLPNREGKSLFTQANRQRVARPAGFEPAAYRLEGGCSNPLSYGRPLAE